MLSRAELLFSLTRAAESRAKVQPHEHMRRKRLHKLSSVCLSPYPLLFSFPLFFFLSRLLSSARLPELDVSASNCLPSSGPASFISNAVDRSFAFKEYCVSGCANEINSLNDHEPLTSLSNRRTRRDKSSLNYCWLVPQTSEPVSSEIAA